MVNGAWKRIRSNGGTREKTNGGAIEKMKFEK